MKKGDFFTLFRKAWVRSFTKETILKSFEATGIAPLNPNVILDRFTRNASEASDSRESSVSILSGEDWRKIERLIKSTVKDQSSKDAKKLSRSLYHISVQNELLHHEIDGLKDTRRRAVL